MIERGDALLLEHGSRLRELVDERRAQLQALRAPAATAQQAAHN